MILKKLQNIRKHNIEKTYRVESYSQNGEDILIDRIFNYKSDGFYIDIGAHHPIRFSNTYKLYKRGWRGINIDAMPGSMVLFNQIRNRDINIEIGVSNKSEKINYYSFNEPALNTFDKQEATKKEGLREYKIIKTYELETKPLSEILDKKLPVGTKIDLLCIDVEGFDFEVLLSNDWKKYRPDLIVVETSDKQNGFNENEIYKLVSDNNYSMISVLYNTFFFINNEIDTSNFIRI